MGRLRRKSLIWLCHQLGTMLAAGLPIRRALDVLIRSARNPSMRKLLREAVYDIEQGCNLHEALQRRRGAFSPLFLNLMKAGEQSGSLDEVFQELLRYYEMLRRLARSFWSRIALPLFEYVAAVAVLAFAFYIITMISSDEGDAAAGPVAIKILLLGYGAPVALVSAYYLITRYLGGMRLMHELLLQVPVIGKVIRNLALARFSWTMKVMYQAAVPMMESLPQALAATGNGAFAARGPGIVGRIQDGSSLRDALEGSRLFPNEYLEILSVGEESGSLEDTLDRLAKNSFESAEFALKALAMVLAGLVWVAVAAFIITFIVILFRRFYLGPIRSLMG